MIIATTIEIGHRLQWWYNLTGLRAINIWDVILIDSKHAVHRVSQQGP